MYLLRKSSSFKKIHMILENSKLLTEDLYEGSLKNLISCVRKIIAQHKEEKPLSKNEVIKKTTFPIKSMAYVLENLKAYNSNPTITLLHKQLIFIHICYLKCSSCQIISEKQKQIFQKQIENVLRELKIIHINQARKNNRFGQIIQFVKRSLSREKEVKDTKKQQKRTKTKSFMNGESSQLNKSIKKEEESTFQSEIITSIYEPYCIYLKKIVEDYEMYAFCKSKDQVKDFEESESNVLAWKLINYLKTLGSMAKKLNSLMRYFKSQSRCYSIMLYYIFSFDIKSFYDILTEIIKIKVTKIKSKYFLSHQTSKKIPNRKIQKLKREEIQRSHEYNEIKQQLTQIGAVNQLLNYLYMNKNTNIYIDQFAQITSINVESENFDFILNGELQQELQKKNNNSRSRGNSDIVIIRRQQVNLKKDVNNYNEQQKLSQINLTERRLEENNMSVVNTESNILNHNTANLYLTNNFFTKNNLNNEEFVKFEETYEQKTMKSEQTLDDNLRSKVQNPLKSDVKRKEEIKESAFAAKRHLITGKR